VRIPPTLDEATAWLCLDEQPKHRHIYDLSHWLCNEKACLCACGDCLHCGEYIDEMAAIRETEQKARRHG
jgi:hypothetical protein